MKNIIFILVDGGRYDYVIKHPVYRSLFSDADWYHRVYAASPYTIGAMHSIFTGMYAKNNGVNGYYNPSKLKETALIIPQYLKKHGYYTFCDITSKIVMADRGFDVYQLHDEYNENIRQRQTDILRKNAADFISKSPFFIYFHYPKIHTNLVTSVLKKYDDFSDEYFENREENIERYKASLDESADYLAELMDVLNETGMMENTELWVLSDHGVSTGERYGERAYGVYLNEYTLHTFVLNYSKDRKGNDDRNIRSSIDLLPIMFEKSGLPVPEGIDGMISRVIEKKGIFRKSADMMPLFCETGGVNGPYPSPEIHNVYGVIKNNEKLVHFRGVDKYEQYILGPDSEERTDKISGELRKLLSEYEPV